MICNFVCFFFSFCPLSTLSAEKLPLPSRGASDALLPSAGFPCDREALLACQCQTDRCHISLGRHIKARSPFSYTHTHALLYMSKKSITHPHEVLAVQHSILFACLRFTIKRASGADVRLNMFINVGEKQLENGRRRRGRERREV